MQHFLIPVSPQNSTVLIAKREAASKLLPFLNGCTGATYTLFRIPATSMLYIRVFWAAVPIYPLMLLTAAIFLR